MRCWLVLVTVADLCLLRGFRRYLLLWLAVCFRRWWLVIVGEYEAWRVRSQGSGRVLFGFGVDALGVS